MRENLRHVVGPGPGGSIFDIVVTGHMLCGDDNVVLILPREQQGRRQPGDACAGGQLNVRRCLIETARRAEQRRGEAQTLLPQCSSCLTTSSRG